MLNISLTIDDRALRGLERLTERQLRYRTSLAMRDTVIKARDALKGDLGRTSGGPIEGGATRWTIGAAQAQFPRPDNLVAEVGLRSDQPRAAGRYISVLTKGGRPRTKGADLAASALAGRRVTMVPTPAQRLDSRGNVSRAAFQKALTGWASMRGSRTIVNRANRMFIIPIKGAEGRMGIFERTGKPGTGRYGERVGTRMKFTLEPEPKPRRSTYDLTGDLQASTQRYWPGEITAQLRAELARAGFR